jgi:hypothetical protein
MASKTYSFFEYLFVIEEQEDGYVIDWNEEFFTDEEIEDDWEDFWKDANVDSPDNFA